MADAMQTVVALSDGAVDGDRIRGYASRFGEADGSGDVVRPGAFAASLARLAAEGRQVAFLWQHDPTRPIGVWESVREDVTGLFVEGRILRDVAAGAEALTLLGAGAMDGLSIGYRVVRAEPRRGGGRSLIEIDLWEVSLVTFPMLPTARASFSLPAQGREALAGALAEALAEGRRSHR
ncbi:MAG: HK97 family phage prohead protease [Pseudomonadota bacterium]